MILPSYPQSGFPVDANWGRQVVDAIRSLRLVAGQGLRKVSDGPNGQVLEATAQTSQQTRSDATPEAFGIKSIVNNTVTIYAGKIWIGKDEKAAADTPLTLNTDSFVGWEYAFGGGLTIKNFGSTFTQDDGFARKPLFYFVYTAPVAPATVGSIALSTGLHMCEVFPANWGSYG